MADSRARMLAGFVPDCLVLFTRLLGDPRVPRSTRILLAPAIVYLAFPLDLIPDFIPVLGQLDDLLLVPAGLWLVLRLIPPPVLADARAQAAAHPARLTRNVWGLILMLLLYALAVGLLWRWWASR